MFIWMLINFNGLLKTLYTTWIWTKFLSCTCILECGCSSSKCCKFGRISSFLLFRLGCKKLFIGNMALVLLLCERHSNINIQTQSKAKCGIQKSHWTKIVDLHIYYMDGSILFFLCTLYERSFPMIQLIGLSSVT